MKKIISIIIYLLLTIPVVASLPYYVAPELLDEIETNKHIYEVNPTSNDAIFDLSMSYAASGQIQKGWDLLKQLPESYSNDVTTKYSALEASDPNEWRYPFKAAFGHFFAGEKIKAIDSFHRVLDIDPEHIWALAFIALVYGEMGNADETIVYCKKALAIEKNATAIHLLIGEAYRKKKKYFTAIRHFLVFGKLYSQHE